MPPRGAGQARAFPTREEAQAYLDKLVEARSFVRCASHEYGFEITEKPGEGEECWEVSWDAHPFRREAAAFRSAEAAAEFLKTLAEKYVLLGDREDRKMVAKKIC